MLFACWDSIMPVVVEKLNDETISAINNGGTVRRTFLITLTLYAVTMTWLRIFILVVLAYVGCAFVAVAADVLEARSESNAWLVNILRVMFNPMYVLNCVSFAHLPFHAFATFAILASIAVPILLYVRDTDRAALYPLRSKMVRILFEIPVIMTFSYMAYAVYCVVKTVV